MQLRFLGTAGAEGWPAVFCSCRACREARAAGGKNIRTRASLLLDRELWWISRPMSTTIFLPTGWNTGNWKYLLVTHGHQDHFSLAVEMAEGTLLIWKGAETLTIAGNSTLWTASGRPWGTREYKLITKNWRLFAREELGRFMVWPLPASHLPEKGPFFICWQVAGRGSSSPMIPTGCRAGLGWLAANADPPLDCVIMECTAGPAAGGEEHMGFAEVLRTRDRLAKMGLLHPGTLCLTTHFSHTGGLLHHQLEEFFAPEGITVAYDGMEVTV